MRQFFLCRYINNIQLLQALKRKNQLKVGPFFVDIINVKIINKIDKCNIAVMLKAIQMSINLLILIFVAEKLCSPKLFGNFPFLSYVMTNDRRAMNLHLHYIILQ